MSFKFFVLKEKAPDHNIVIKSHNLADAKKWCEENCTHEWEIEDGCNYVYDGYNTRIIRFAFANKNESMTFKMIWGE